MSFFLLFLVSILFLVEFIIADDAVAAISFAVAIVAVFTVAVSTAAIGDDNNDDDDDDDDDILNVASILSPVLSS